MLPALIVHAKRACSDPFGNGSARSKRVVQTQIYPIHAPRREAREAVNIRQNTPPPRPSQLIKSITLPYAAGELLVAGVYLFLTPVLQTLRSHLGKMGNKQEAIGETIAACWLTALQMFIPMYFGGTQRYVFRGDRILNILAWGILFVELLLAVLACVRFSDIRTQLTFVLVTCVAPTLVVGVLSLVYLFMSPSALR